MRLNRAHLLFRLAVIALLAMNVVPDALAAVPLCKYDFAPGTGSPAAGVTLNHSHGNLVAHECVATMPDRQAMAHQLHVVPDQSAVPWPPAPHPVAMLTARWPSPRGSPANAYLIQRSSVLLLI